MSPLPKKSEATTDQKTVISLPYGRMVILEELNEENSDVPSLIEMAQAGQGGGYVRYCADEENTVNSSDAPGMTLRILIRPTMHARHAGQLAALTAVAVARAIERHSDMKISIRWVNDLYTGSRKIGAVLTNAQMNAGGFFDYAVIRISLAIAPSDFPPRLGDVIRRVFNNENISLCANLAESIVEEFFTLYDNEEMHPDCMTDYRKRLTVIGRRVKVLTGERFERGRVVDIDSDACLIVRLRRDRMVMVTSRSEVVL